MRVEITMRCRAWGRIANHQLYVDTHDGDVRVWDPVAGHYCICDDLSSDAARRARKIAAEKERAE